MVKLFSAEEGEGDGEWQNLTHKNGGGLIHTFLSICHLWITITGGFTAQLLSACKNFATLGQNNLFNS